MHDSSREALQQEQLEQDSMKCRELGWETDTPKYDECMDNEHKARMETEEKFPDSFLDGGWWIGTWF